MGLRPVPLHGVMPGGRGCMCFDRDCKERDWGKHTPDDVENLWKDGHRFAPRDFLEGNNVALAMGPWDGGDDWLVCLDVDGSMNLGQFVRDLPDTLEAKSPRGEHLICRVPAYTPLGNWVDVFATKPGPSLDLRYARGRIVVAPSRSAFGAYEWEQFMRPAPLPERVIDVILDQRRARGLDVQTTWDRGRKRAS